MIIEGLLTTTSADGSPHVAPMGPVVNQSLDQWLLRPFQTSTTFANLRRHSSCIFHVMDDVLPIVQAALSLPVDVSFEPAASGGWVIQSACHWYCLETGQWDLSQPRSQVPARVITSKVQRPFWGWNRAKHAVLEATILATRIHLTGHDAVRQELDRLDSAVLKTGGPRETAAWQLLREFVSP
ncbi:MAG: DUF447 family protein [Pirellulaceae bacterium]|nr:DUF447 family protein [Pirellulaceae bacterium]